MLDHQIGREVWQKGRRGLIFIKKARCFEVKKAINHELEIHGYGGGEEEDEEEMMMVGVGAGGVKMRAIWAN